MKYLVLLLLSLTVSSVFAVEYRVGDRIIDQYGNTGNIVLLFNNKRAEIILDQYPAVTYVRELATLGKAFYCIETVCIGHRIIDAYSNRGWIQELFHNGMARIVLDQHTGSYTRRLSSLGITLGCLQDDTCILKSEE